MLVSRIVAVLVLMTGGLIVSGCGAITRGLGSVTSEGLVDEYAIPQNRGLAMPTDFSRLPTPQNPQNIRTTLPSQAEIESLMFTLEPEPEPDYVPMTVVTGEVPEYRPIGRIVGSGSNGVASQAFISAQTNASGSLFPVFEESSAVMTGLEAGQASAPLLPDTSALLAPVPAVAAPSSSVAFVGGDGVTVLSPEDVAALSALAVGAPVSNMVPVTVPSQPAAFDAQVVTSLPEGVSVVGAPVVLQR
jgi:hypothetical protein